MFCVNCGKDLKGYEESKFCPFCGAAVGGSSENASHSSQSVSGISLSEFIPKQITSETNPKRLLLCALTAFSALGLFIPFIFFYVSAFGYGSNSRNTYTVLGLYKQLANLESFIYDWGLNIDLSGFKGMLIVPIIAFLAAAIAGIASLYNALALKDNMNADSCAVATAISSAIGILVVWIESATLNSQIASEIGEEGAWLGISASVNMTTIAFVLLIANVITVVLAKTVPVGSKGSINSQPSVNKVCKRCGEHFMLGDICPSCGSKDIREE